MAANPYARGATPPQFIQTLGEVTGYIPPLQFAGPNPYAAGPAAPRATGAPNPYAAAGVQARARRPRRRANQFAQNVAAATKGRAFKNKEEFANTVRQVAQQYSATLPVEQQRKNQASRAKAKQLRDAHRADPYYKQYKREAKTLKELYIHAGSTSLVPTGKAIGINPAAVRDVQMGVANGEGILVTKGLRAKAPASALSIERARLKRNYFYSLGKMTKAQRALQTAKFKGIWEGFDPQYTMSHLRSLPEAPPSASAGPKAARVSLRPSQKPKKPRKRTIGTSP
jgi:hypothetical protein